MEVAKGHEFVLVNYGGSPGLDEFVDTIEYDNFKYINVGAKYFHMSKSRNLSVLLSSGDYVFFLDADTFISRQTITTLHECIEQDKYYGSYYCHDMIYGVSRENFFKVGGFDETFEGYSLDDLDLSSRLRMIGVEYYRPEVAQVIRHLEHPDEMRLDNYRPGFRMRTTEHNGAKYNYHKDNNIYKVNLDGFAHQDILND